MWESGGHLLRVGSSLVSFTIQDHKCQHPCLQKPTSSLFIGSKINCVKTNNVVKDFQFSKVGQRDPSFCTLFMVAILLVILTFPQELIMLQIVKVGSQS